MTAPFTAASGVASLVWGNATYGMLDNGVNVVTAGAVYIVQATNVIICRKTPGVDASWTIGNGKGIYYELSYEVL